MVHVTRYFTALAFLLALFGGYALIVAPWLEPPAVVRAAESPTTAPAIKPLELPAAWAALFPPDAWERKNPKIVETPRCTLLIQDYQTTADGRLELRPCTLIFHSASALADESAPRDPASSRPIILQAPKAELAFDKPLDLSRTTFGRVEKGTLSGEIRIFSPPSHESSRDALEIRTRAVWLDKETIRTANDVEFRYGDSSGRGRDLEIALLQRSEEEPAAPRSQALGVHSLTLRRLEYLRLVVPSASLPGAAPPRGSQLAAGLPQSPGEQLPTSPLEITCQGEFVFDFPSQVARFLDQVRVARANLPGIPPDSLACDELLLTLGGNQPDPKPAGAVADPLAGRLQRIIALGKPAVLEIGSRAIRATAAYLEYSLVENSIQLKSNPAQGVPTVVLSQLEQHCIAPELHYQVPATGRLGRLHAGGPGELRFLQGRGAERHFITAQWQRTLEMQPQDNNHVITLQGAATVGMGSLGKFSANELHFWVVEAPPPAAEPPANPSTTRLPPSTPDAPKESLAILPDRLLAVGDVRLISPRLDIDTSRLEAWFLNLPADPAGAPQPRRIDGPIREPVARVSYEQQPPAGTIHDTVRPSSPQHFHVSGGVIRTQLVLRGNQFDLEDLNIRGQAQVDETITPEPGLQPLRLRGDLLEIRHGTRPQAYLQITGLPAEVGGRGMSLAGGQIEAYREKNELRVAGPGEAKAPASGGGQAGLLPGLTAATVPANTPLGGPPAGNPPSRDLHIVWNDGLVFDGWTARFLGDVVLRTDAQTAHTPVLTATLNRRFDFSAQLPATTTPSSEPPLALARILLDGQSQGVYVTGQSFDEFGVQQSRDQARLANIAFDQLSGAILAQGPGWVSTVRRRANISPADGGGPPTAATPVPQVPDLARGNGQSDLTSIHVAFEREIAGDLNQRWIEFRQQVLTTYAPAIDFDTVIAADPLGKLPEGVILMRSETLRITEVPRLTPPAFELRAQGGTRVESAGVLVDAPLVGYASNKDTLTIEGDGRATAKVFFKQPREGSLEGQKFWYNLKTGELQMDVVKSMQFDLRPGGGLSFPGPRPVLPKRQQ